MPDLTPEEIYVLRVFGGEAAGKGIPRQWMHPIIERFYRLGLLTALREGEHVDIILTDAGKTELRKAA